MTPEQQILLDKAARSLQAARELNQTGFAEFAASRAYYAMFLHPLPRSQEAAPQKPGFCDNLCILTEIWVRNPVSLTPRD